MRDDYMCQSCGKVVVGKDAHVDHIVTIEDDPTMRTMLSNLRTLCQSCHSRRTVGDMRFK